MTVSSISPGGMPTVDPVVATSPQMIMYLARRRVQGLDDQIRHVTNQIDDKTRKANELSRQLMALQNVLTRVENDKKGVKATMRIDEVSDNNHMLTEDGERLSIEQYLEDAGVDLRVLPTFEESGHECIKPEHVEQAINTIKQELQQTNSGNEMRMIQLQTLMQQRTESINLCSNMLKRFDEAANNAIGNIR